MTIKKLLTAMLVLSLLGWAAEVLYLSNWNATEPVKIKSREVHIRNQSKLENKRKLSKLEQEYERKKHLATGETVFDRIFNTQDQTIIELIKRISQEALPENWTCEVKVEEFAHFILLIYHPHNSQRSSLNQILSYLQPITKYCGWCLIDVAVFDNKHKSYLFFDNTMLDKMASGESFSREMLRNAKTYGDAFTRFDSITINCEKYESHLLLPIDITGPNGILSCQALLDTGASTTMLSKEIIMKTGLDNIYQAPRRTFSTVNGLMSCPIVSREINVSGVRKKIEVAVNQRDSLNLIGMNFFEGMDYIIDFKMSAVYVWEK